jgi:phosphoglycerol transferase
MTTSTLDRPAFGFSANPNIGGPSESPTAGFGARFWKEARVQIAGLMICLALLGCVMKLWEANLHVPFAYHGDTVLMHLIVKGTVENGWYLHNEALGAPGAMDLHDFPMADTVHLLWIAGLRLFTRDHALIFNLFYLLTFPLTTATTIWALRRLGVSRLGALVFGLLYAFQPYHFLRGTGHYFLSAYYLVPPFLWLVVRIYQGRGPLFGIREQSESGRSWGLILTAVAIAILAGGGGVYYAFFGCFLALVAGLSAALSLRRWAPLLNACVLSGITTVSLAACLAPSVMYWRAHGPNPAAVDRSPAMAETLGLKITQLVMPAPMHRITRLRRWMDYFLDAAPLNNENSCSSLGLLASAGFLWLVARLLVRGRNAIRTDPVEGLTVLNGAALLLGTVGGFGALSSWCGVTWIRGYNRISILIAFFGLAMLALAFDRLAANLAPARRTKIGLGALAFLVLLFGVFDQAPLSAQPAYERVSKEYLADEEFIHELERRVPAGTMIFELPYQRFVEHVPAPGLNCYDMMRPYLHSQHLHWSYGSIDGRPAHAWHKAISQLPVRELLAEIRGAGFGAIYIDRQGFPDRAAKLEAELKAELGTEPYVSENQRLSIYLVSGKL